MISRPRAGKTVRHSEKGCRAAAESAEPRLSCRTVWTEGIFHPRARERLAPFPPGDGRHPSAAKRPPSAGGAGQRGTAPAGSRGFSAGHRGNHRRTPKGRRTPPGAGRGQNPRRERGGTKAEDGNPPGRREHRDRTRERLPGCPNRRRPGKTHAPGGRRPPDRRKEHARRNRFPSPDTVRRQKGRRDRRRPGDGFPERDLRGARRPRMGSGPEGNLR